MTADEYRDQALQDELDKLFLKRAVAIPPRLQ
jgi:hypothetical protein